MVSDINGKPLIRLDPITAIVVGAVTSVASAVSSVVQGERASRKAKRAGRAQANALRAEAAAERERGRRLAASARARFGAAGVTQQGTPLIVGAANLLENIRVRERILAGARNVQLDASSQADAFRIQGIAGAIGGLSQAASFVSQIPPTTPATASVNPPGFVNRNPLLG